MEYQTHVRHNVRRRRNQIILLLLKFYSFWNDARFNKVCSGFIVKNSVQRVLSQQSNLKSTKKH